MTNVGCHLGLINIGENSELIVRFVQHSKHNPLYNTSVTRSSLITQAYTPDSIHTRTHTHTHTLADGQIPHIACEPSKH